MKKEEFFISPGRNLIDYFSHERNTEPSDNELRNRMLSLKLSASVEALRSRKASCERGHACCFNP